MTKRIMDARVKPAHDDVGDCASNRYLTVMTIETPDRRDIDVLTLASRSGWPEDLRVLIARYPREQWAGHVNLGGMARFWLSRHAMFRDLAGMLTGITNDFREGRMPAAEFPRQFAPRLQFMLQQLDLHHYIEDHHHFPVFRAADERLARGFDVLENDHGAIHDDMERTAHAANDLLRAVGNDKDAWLPAGDKYADASAALLRGLMRHLDDEEDLIVPLILDRGEDALGVGH
jgi:hemerythrin HHE cation binding domain-containing protein